MMFEVGWFLLPSVYFDLAGSSVFYVFVYTHTCVFRLFCQGAVMITIKQLGGDYGLQKLFGTFGAIIWGPVTLI